MQFKHSIFDQPQSISSELLALNFEMRAKRFIGSVGIGRWNLAQGDSAPPDDIFS